MSSIKARINNLEKDVKMIAANYHVIELDSCEHCKYLRRYNNTCAKNSIRVSIRLGTCNYFTKENENE